jgi:hypothetical protein
MRRIAMMLLGLSLLAGQTAHGVAPGVQEETRRFLDGYAKGDEAQLLTMIAPEFTAYGSDASEVFHGPEAFRRMLADDQRLWGGKASIGPMKDVSVAQGESMACVMFDADFKVGDRPPVLVRFAVTWKLVGGRWLVAQSSNTVPTVGQSAAELLKPR